MTQPAASGQAVIGVVGADLPRQVVLAAGAVPYRVLGSWHGDVPAEAAEMLGAVDVVAARILGDLLAGKHAGLAGLVVCNDSAAHLRLFYVLRMLALRGQLSVPVQLLDAPRGGGGPRGRFVARQYRRLSDFCAQITGVRPDDAALRVAAERERALGDALGRLRGRRVRGECTGAAALAAYRIAAQQEPEEAVAAVDAASGSPEGRPRVFVTGSAHPDRSLYEAIEAAGLVVVGEDHDTGDAAWLGDPADVDGVDETFAALAELHAVRAPSATRSPTAERSALLSSRVSETGAVGVLSLVRELDDASAWDLAGQRAAVRVPFEARTRIVADGALDVAADAASSLARALKAGRA